jgi:hypothetical protein
MTVGIDGCENALGFEYDAKRFALISDVIARMIRLAPPRVN